MSIPRRPIPARAQIAFAAALAASGVAPEARADSAVGTNIASGSQLNPTGLFLGLSTGRLSNFWEQSRSPTGLLYPRPPILPEMVQATSNPDWWSSAWAEVGFFGSSGKTGVASFREYGDWSNGPLISNAGFIAENRRTAFYVSANVGNVARDDQYYQLNVGKYGVFNTTLSYDEIPHVFTTNAKLLWNGGGTGNLTLPSGLTPGASTVPQVQSALSKILPGEFSLERQKAGFSFTYTPSEEYDVFFRVGNEWRDGERPMGATFNYPPRPTGTGSMELAEPIHYQTLDVTAGVRFKGEELQANITYAGSFFSNDVHSLTWENPGLVAFGAGVFVPPRGRLALPPDNNYHTLKGDLAWNIAPKTRFVASAAYARMRQDADLLPPTINTGTIRGLITTINLANWNTVDSLSRKTADAAIDTFNLFAQFQTNITDDLRLDFELRDRNEDNKTNYLALNPLTGQYGYIATDGGLAAQANGRYNGVYEPGAPGSFVQIRNIPFARDNLDLTARAGYSFANRDRLEVSFISSSIRNEHREVPESRDNRARAQFTTRVHEWGTVRAWYEFANLSGDDYNSFPYNQYNSSSLPGYVTRFATGDAPFTLDPLRKYDVADRTEHKLKTQTNFILSEKIDLQLIGGYRIDHYNAQYGLRRVEIWDLNAEVNYQLSTNTTLSAFYTYQRHQRNMANITTGTTAAGGAAGSSTYPFANAWTEATDDKNDALGVGLHHKYEKLTLDINYTYTHANGGIGYTFASPTAYAAGLTPGQVGTGFPPTTFDDHLLETSLLWNYTPNIGIRAYYRLEYERLDDFHYTGLTNIAANNIYLAAVPQNYTAHIFGMFFQYSY